LPISLERLDEGALRGSGHIEAMDDAVGLDVFHQSLLEDRIVVAVIQRTCASEEIDVFAPGLVRQHRTSGLLEHYRKRAYVATYLGLQTIKYFQVHLSSPCLALENICEAPWHQEAPRMSLVEGADSQQHLVLMSGIWAEQGFRKQGLFRND